MSCKSSDVVCFTSASQVNNLFVVAQQLCRKESLQAGLNTSMVASIDPVCTTMLTKFGVKVDIESSLPKLGPFIDAINNRLSSSVSAVE
ncbi:MAG: uroporphyrinogen-III synthase [Methylotenera sp.]|nr:uroporphyrinogen-III synthase [Methylotenera sp.]